MTEVIIPPKSHPIWESIIRGNVSINFSYLAISLLVTRLQSDFRSRKNQDILRLGVSELYHFFDKKKMFPFVQEDIKKLTNYR